PDMVGIAQLVEHLVVVQGAAGSSPVTHPKEKDRGFLLGLFAFLITWLAPRSTRELGRHPPDHASPA
ncbi:MAG: hypothetical protein RL460_610, partial [Actinomycetota bacterium]